jgi:hypothetical protein
VVEGQAAVVSINSVVKPRVSVRRLLQFISLLVAGPITVAAFVIGFGPELAVLVVGLVLMVWSPKSPAALERLALAPLPLLGTIGRWKMRTAGALGVVIFLVSAGLAAPLLPPRASVLVPPAAPAVDNALSASIHLVGNISYFTYSDAGCTHDRRDVGRAAFGDGVIPPSKPVAFSADGAYWWRAELAGNAGASVMSFCTPLTVGRASSPGATVGGSFQIVLRPASADRGVEVTAQALVPATAEFALYRVAACAGTVQMIPGTGVGTVINSRPVELGDAGTYSWKGSMKLGNLELSNTACVAMALAKKTPSLVGSAISNAQIGVRAPAGLRFFGASGHAGGEIRFNVYTDSSCSSLLSDAGGIAVDRGATSDAGPTPSLAGSYYWRAIYAGDGSNEAASSACMAMTVAKNRPTIAFVAPGSVSAGRTLSDAARLSGATSTASGTAHLSVFSDGACTSRVSSGQTAALTGGVLPAIAGFEQVGIYPVQVIYDGDSNNESATSPCEVVTVRAASPTVTQRLGATSVGIGGSVRAGALLTLSTAGAGGTLTYGLFNDASCAGAPVATAGSGPVKNGQIPDSELKTFGNAGVAYWQAIYSGDANNSAASSACMPLTVTPNAPTASVTLSRSTVPIGVSVGASVTLLGATGNAGGTVKYTLYNDSSCTANPPVDAGTKTVASGKVPDSDPISFAGTGFAYWQAVYSGDGNNRRAETLCLPVIVTRATPSIVALLSSTNVTVGDGITVSARLAGTSASPGGTVSYVRATDSACRTTTAISTRPVSGTLVGPSLLTTLATVGTTYVQASYSGDGNNATATSDCVAITVRQWVDACGAASNPFHFSFCGSALIYSPPAGFCTYFACIATFGSGRGYVIQCADGLFGNSGGISGSCSGHSGNRRALYLP